MRMQKTCKYCGGIHDERFICPMKPKKKCKNYHADGEIQKLRNSIHWKRKREKIKQRDKYMCLVCKQDKHLNLCNISVHHIIPLEEDMSKAFDDDNLISLCEQHHHDAERGKISRAVLNELVARQTEAADISPGGV